uniref:Protein JTB n=1 Tax=Balaenoptera musculus TaxID=9771 RepID=A0A8C0C409_BALMU
MGGGRFPVFRLLTFAHFPPLHPLQPSRSSRAGGEAVRWVMVWEPDAPIVFLFCFVLTSSHIPRDQVEKGGTTWSEGIQLCWEVHGQNLGEKYFVNEVWGLHFSPCLVSTSNLPCWLVEEFVLAEECAPCSNFQAKTTPECGSTGYVEKITCSSSKRSEFKSCRSALMEQHLFWKFEGTVIGVALVFACLVIVRQRQLDRKALEKVRKQIESI